MIGNTPQVLQYLYSINYVVIYVSCGIFIGHITLQFSFNIASIMFWFICIVWHIYRAYNTSIFVLLFQPFYTIILYILARLYDTLENWNNPEPRPFMWDRDTLSFTDDTNYIAFGGQPITGVVTHTCWLLKSCGTSPAIGWSHGPKRYITLFTPC